MVPTRPIGSMTIAYADGRTSASAARYSAKLLLNQNLEKPAARPPHSKRTCSSARSEIATLHRKEVRTGTYLGAPFPSVGSGVESGRQVNRYPPRVSGDLFEMK